MEQKKVIRDFKVLTEQISPDNVAVMAELIAMRETKALIGYYGYYAEKAHKNLCRDILGYYGYYAEKAHKNLCRDIFGKHEPGYIFSDSYDFVQSVALFLCDHFGEYLDDVLYISKKGKPRTIKIECYRIVTRMLARGHRAFCRCQCFEFTKEEPELVYEYQTDEEQDFSRADEIAASLNLTENMSLALDYRMSGLSYPEIAKQLSRAVSTVYEYFEKMRARYSAIYG